MKRLKPCPFCGGKAKYREIEAVEIDTPNAGAEYIECTMPLGGLTR
jgi:hypothetical protein